MNKCGLRILTFCAILICLSGCGKEQLKNYVAAMPLSREQQQIVNLLTTKDHVAYIYEFKSQDEYITREFWTEVYKDGILADAHPAGITTMSNEGEPLDGAVAVCVNRTPDFQWTYIYTEKGTKVNHDSEPNKNYGSDGFGYASISQPVEIKAGEEITLCAYAFARDGKIKAFTPQSLSDKTALADYEYVHLIKCKFSK